ncbi:MAG: hypothetical protein IJ335_11525 [Lachnospiraceae bacterium]|nr:hypothetical protein [Lachnospiraceae bacterium]
MTDRKSCGFFAVIGILFLFCCFTGYELEHKGNIVWSGSYLLFLLVVCIAGGIVLGTGLFLLLRKIEGKCVCGKAETKAGGCGRAFLLYWLLLVLSRIPAFLAYFPGIGAYDFTIQLEQIREQAYNEHHPLCHTLLIEAFIRIGEGLGDATIGIALLTLLQILILTAVMAGGIALLKRNGIRKGWLIALLVLGMLLPFHWYMSISITKDILFTAFFLGQLLILCRLLTGPEGQKISLWDGGYVVASVLMILFRNNGRYALLALLMVLTLMILWGRKARRLWGKLWMETFAGFLLGSLVLALMMQITDAQQGDRREMLSMPIQQLGRCMIYHGGIGVLETDDATMEQADKDFINEFIINEAYRAYRPDIADPLKRYTNTSAILRNPKQFLSTYLGMFVKYPGDYLNAALAVNAGYLNPLDESHAYINVTDGERGLGYIQTRWLEEQIGSMGISQDSKWPRLYAYLEFFAENNMHLQLPIVRYLLVPGTYLWLYLLLAAWLLVHKRFRQILPLTLIGGYYLTLLLGPTVQLRYIYPVMVALPYLMLWLLQKKE